MNTKNKKNDTEDDDLLAIHRLLEEIDKMRNFQIQIIVLMAAVFCLVVIVLFC